MAPIEYSETPPLKEVGIKPAIKILLLEVTENYFVPK